MDLMSIAQILGGFGEFFGAIAVVVTLIYLSIQVRQGIVATQATHRDALANSRQDFLLRVASDAEMGKLFQRGMFDESSLEADERLRFGMLIYAVFEQTESAHSQWKRGVLTDSDWSKSKKILRDYLTQPGIRAVWERDAQNFSGEFREFVATLEPGDRWTQYAP